MLLRFACKSQKILWKLSKPLIMHCFVLTFCSNIYFDLHLFPLFFFWEHFHFFLIFAYILFFFFILFPRQWHSLSPASTTRPRNSVLQFGISSLYSLRETRSCNWWLWTHRFWESGKVVLQNHGNELPHNDELNIVTIYYANMDGAYAGTAYQVCFFSPEELSCNPGIMSKTGM